MPFEADQADVFAAFLFGGGGGGNKFGFMAKDNKPWDQFIKYVR